MNKSNKSVKTNTTSAPKELKGYKYKLVIPNSAVEQDLSRFAGCCRKVWNIGFNLVKTDDSDYNEQRAMLLMAGASPAEIKSGLVRDFKYNPYSQLSAMLTNWKKEPELNYLPKAYSKSLQIKLEELGRAFEEAKDPSNPKQYPTFKKKWLSNEGFSFNGDIKHDAKNARIFIPKLKAWLRYIKSRDIQGTIKNVTFSKQAGNWYVAFQTERPRVIATIPTTEMLGIDLGVAKTISCSSPVKIKYHGQEYTGKQINSINPLKQYQDKLAQLQRKLSRKIKFSQNWRKVKAKITKLHSKIANIRKDFLHKVTTAIVKDYANVTVEELKVKNMTKSAAGTVEQPGRNVRQKSGLNRVILDQGWGMFKTFLKYKLKYMYGTELTEVNPKHTSQECSQCHYIHKDNRETQANFVCKSCGHVMNADINASMNIKTKGIKAAGMVVKQKPGSKIPEPTRIGGKSGLETDRPVTLVST